MKNLICSIILLSISALSCQKSTQIDDPSLPDNGPALSGCRISSIKMDTTEIKLQYDNQGNLTELSNFDNNRKKSYTLFTYSATQIIESNYTGTGILAGTLNYTKGSNGFAAYAVASSDSHIDSTYYTYNTDGYLIGLKKRFYMKGRSGNMELNYTLLQEYTILNGNRVHQTETMRGVSSNYDSDITYEYYTDKRSYGSVNAEYPFLGKINSALVRKLSYKQGTFNSTEDYTYEFDSADKPVKSKQVSSSEMGTETVNILLDYTCN